MGLLVSLLCIGAAAAPVGREVGVGEYRAVLYSAQDYADDSGVPDLETPNNDIARIGQVLEEQYGFTVEGHPDATRAEIVSSLTRLADETGEDDVLLVYYAGHGQYDARQRVGYWLPSDARGGDQSTWLGNPTVQGLIRGITARHVVLVIDACFSGEFARERGIEVLVDDDRFPGQRLARRLASEPSRVYLSSGGNETVSDEPPPGRSDEDEPPVSVFAYFFHKLLAQAEQRYVMPSDLVLPLRQRVFDNANQTPRFGVVANTGHGGGEVVLVNQEAEPCIEGTDACLGDTITAADVPATWQYDPATRAFEDPNGVRIDRRALGTGLLVAAAASTTASILFALSADNDVDSWTAEFETCAARPIPGDCEAGRDGDQAAIDRKVAWATTFGVSGGLLAIGAGVSFTVPRRARRRAESP